MKIFLSPHSDDETLFGSYIIQNEKPLVIVCTDDYRSDNSIITRRNESRLAMDILGADLWFFGIQDNIPVEAFKKILMLKLKRLPNVSMVYAPSMHTSNKHHLAVSEAATRLFGDKVIYYETYFNDWGPEGTGNQVRYSKKMKTNKINAMKKYTSQISSPTTKKHFKEVWNEYIHN